MSYKIRIEDLIGSVGDDALISQSLQDTGNDIINAIPATNLISYAKTSSITSSGLDISSFKLLAVEKSNVMAKEVSAFDRARYVDSGSIYFSSLSTPVYYIEGEKVYVIGAGASSETSGDAHYIPLTLTSDGSTQLVYSHSTVANFPAQAEQILVLGAAIKCLQRLMADKSDSLPADISSVSLPVSPSAPSAPSFTYTDVSVSDIVQPIIEISDMASLTESAPSYIQPILALQAAPTISDLTISVTIPSVPTINTILYSDASNSDASASSVGAITVSSVSKADISGDVPTYIEPVIAPSFSTVDTFISTDEDVELAASKIQEINSQISEYNSKIQNAQNVFNKENVKYQANVQAELAKHNSDLQKEINQAQLDARDAQQEAQQTTDMDKFNKAQDQVLELTNKSKQMERLIADNNNKLQKYNGELDAYQKEVSKQLQEYQQNLEADLKVWQAERQTDLQKYSSDMQNALNSFNEENVVYQQDIQRKIQNFNKDTQVAIQNAQQEFTTRKSNLDKQVRIDLQNATQNYQKDVEEYRSNISKYSSEVQDYQAEVSATIQKYSADVQNYAAKMQKHSTDYQWKQGQYQQLKAEYAQGLQLLISGSMPQKQGA